MNCPCHTRLQCPRFRAAITMPNQLLEAVRSAPCAGFCNVCAALPEWANLAKHTDYNRTAETDGRDCECWAGEVRA